MFTKPGNSLFTTQFKFRGKRVVNHGVVRLKTYAKVNKLLQFTNLQKNYYERIVNLLQIPGLQIQKTHSLLLNSGSEVKE